MRPTASINTFVNVSTEYFWCSERHVHSTFGEYRRQNLKQGPVTTVQSFKNPEQLQDYSPMQWSTVWESRRASDIVVQSLASCASWISPRPRHCCWCARPLDSPLTICLCEWRDGIRFNILAETPNQYWQPTTVDSISKKLPCRWKTFERLQLILCVCSWRDHSRKVSLHAAWLQFLHFLSNGYAKWPPRSLRETPILACVLVAGLSLEPSCIKLSGVVGTRVLVSVLQGPWTTSTIVSKFWRWVAKSCAFVPVAGTWW